jgi:hypothetical protein
VARSYSTRLVALTTGADPRWLDNLLSRHELPGVSKRQRGVERRITDAGVLSVELVRILNLELGVSVEAAVAIARDVSQQRGAAAEIRTASGLALVFPLEAIQQRLRTRLGEATEFIARVPRGRPRLSGSGAGDL